MKAWFRRLCKVLADAAAMPSHVYYVHDYSDVHITPEDWAKVEGDMAAVHKDFEKMFADMDEAIRKAKTS